MAQNLDFDICVIGSGAGAGPLAYELAQSGLKVLVLEKGPWIKTKDFTKDEILTSRRSVYTTNLNDEPQVIEKVNTDGEWQARSNQETGQDLWNGNCVGGSTNFMSGYFGRLKPSDFKLLSTYGPIDGANIVDWPIGYEELEPFYTETESLIGISGKVMPHDWQEPRSTSDFPYPPLQENILAQWLDEASEKHQFGIIPLPRAILSQPVGERKACYYSGYCGSYGCSSDAKSSSRVAVLEKALASGNLTILPDSKVFRLEEEDGKVIAVWFYNKLNEKIRVKAHVFVIAAQAIETCRLLLMSPSKNFPNGLANNTHQVGKNLIFAGGGSGSGEFYKNEMSADTWENLNKFGLFLNRTTQKWYQLNEEPFNKPVKGGSIDFIMEHPNGITRAINQKWDSDGKLEYGSPFKKKLFHHFTQVKVINFEVFVDWLPTENCFVQLGDSVKDKWGDPVAQIRIQGHPHDVEVGKIVAKKAEHIIRSIGASNVVSHITSAPPPNLVAGGCRFGNDRKTSVLNSDCRAHDISNLYITDGSWIPNGGSIPHTWTIYANSLRVARIIQSGYGKTKV